jgi:hypothetical protein
MHVVRPRRISVEELTAVFDLAIVLVVFGATGVLMGGFCWLASVQSRSQESTEMDTSVGYLRRGGIIRTRAAGRLTRLVVLVSLAIVGVGATLLLLRVSSEQGADDPCAGQTRAADRRPSRKQESRQMHPL